MRRNGSFRTQAKVEAEDALLGWMIEAITCGCFSKLLSRNGILSLGKIKGEESVEPTYRKKNDIHVLEKLGLPRRTGPRRLRELLAKRLSDFTPIQVFDRSSIQPIIRST